MPRALQWILALTVAVVAASAVSTVLHVRTTAAPAATREPRLDAVAVPRTTEAAAEPSDAADEPVRPAGGGASQLAMTDVILEASPRDVPGSQPRHVVLWGDSLAHESAEFFEWAVHQHPGFEVETRTWGGTAACDWFAEIMHWPDSKPVDIAVLEFSGNSRTHCMRDGDGRHLKGADRVEKYRTDVEAEALHLRDHGATVYLIGAPLFRPDVEPNRVEALNAMYQEIAARHDGIEFVDAGAAVLADGVYADRLPCAPWEGPDQGCVNGTVAVRSPDGVHFCPTEFARRSCPVFSPGAFRFAMAMAAPVTAAT